MKTFLRLLFKCAAVMLPLILMVAFFSQRQMSYTDGEIPDYLWNKEVATTEQEKYYSVIVLGDSLANAAYMPEILGGGIINLSLSGTTPLENYYTLKNWLEHHEAPKVCYISFQDHHFVREDCFWTRSIYSHRYSVKENVEMLRAAMKYDEASVLTDNWLWDYLSYEMWLPNKYIAAFMNSSFNQRVDSNQKTWDNIELHKGKYVLNTSKEKIPTGLYIPDVFSVRPMFDDYYRKMIELCLENGIWVRLIKLPVPEYYVLTDEYTAAVEQYYGKLQEDYPEITVDWFPAYEWECYANTHFNIHGAMRFSTAVRELYPEDFEDTELTKAGASGLNDYIKREVRLSNYFEWLSCTGYTAVLYDAQGRFESVYGQEMSVPAADVTLPVCRPDLDQTSEDDSIFYVPGADGAAGLEVYREDGKLMIRTDSAKPKQWKLAKNADLGLAVVDSFGRIVCTKSFCYEESGFTIAE